MLPYVKLGPKPQKITALIFLAVKARDLIERKTTKLFGLADSKTHIKYQVKLLAVLNVPQSTLYNGMYHFTVWLLDIPNPQPADRCGG